MLELHHLGNIVREVLLNLSATKLLSLDVRGNNLVSIFIVCRAFDGRKERNSRAVFALGENGLKAVETSVMNLVIILNWKAAEEDN